MRYSIQAILSIVLVLSGAAAEDDLTLRYSVERNERQVGNGTVTVSRRDGATTIDYRMRIKVRLVGITMYSLRSHQRVELDREMRLVSARCSADVDGEHFDVRVSRRERSYLVEVNGDAREIDASLVDWTTIHPIVASPGSGTWLDLTNGKPVPYVVSRDGDAYVLEHEGGADRLYYYDNDGYLSEIIATTRRGSLRMTRSG